MILWGLDCTNLANKSRERNLKPYTWSPSHVEINFIIILCWWEFNWSSSQVRVNNLDQWSSYTTSQYCKSRFLKLMLGVAVTCSNKQTFIDKIQVTACVAVNIDGWHEDDNCDLPKKYRLPSKWEIKHFSPWTRQHNTLSLLALPLSSTQRWATGPNKIKIKIYLAGVDLQTRSKLWYISISPLQEWTGRISAQSLNSELKMATPPGDEIWAQKCHELDFQVGSIWMFNILPPSSSPSPSPNHHCLHPPPPHDHDHRWLSSRRSGPTCWSRTRISVRRCAPPRHSRER